MKKILIILSLLAFADVSLARNIFLNGKDISSAKGQKLDKVSVFISENGDIFITAPQYQVYEEKTFVPLAKAKNKDNKPSVAHPTGLPSASGMVPGATPVSKLSVPEETEENQKGLIEKAGTRFID